jgi:hypothetical protein
MIFPTAQAGFCRLMGVCRAPRLSVTDYNARTVPIAGQTVNKNDRTGHNAGFALLSELPTMSRGLRGY